MYLMSRSMRRNMRLAPAARAKPDYRCDTWDGCVYRPHLPLSAITRRSVCVICGDRIHLVPDVTAAMWHTDNYVIVEEADI